MKYLLILIAFISLSVKSQTLIAYDNIEVWSWGTGGAGWAGGCGPCGYYTNASVTTTTSAALIGAGNAASAIESGTYILTNITGLDLNSQYVFKFRSGSYKFSAPSAATAGNDAPDYFDVQYSSNGGTSYTTEMRITGFSNAIWDYNTSATAAKTANGVMTTYSPTAGGNRTSTGDGYSIIQLTLPIGVTQLAFRIPTRANSNGEEWWFDNFELIKMYSLPIELINFTGVFENNYNLIQWSSASEHNNAYYILEKSIDGTNWDILNTQSGAGNSVDQLDYTFRDTQYNNGINYYRLSQVDFDGQSETFNIISIDNSVKIKNITKLIDLLGREVDQYTHGTLFEVYDDGTIKKVLR